MNIRSLMVAWLTMVALYARPTEASDVPVGFEYPCIRVALSDPDNDCWTGMDLNGNYPVPVDPDRWLVGPPPSELSGVTLPTDHWVELGFCGPIGDGPGPDIILTEQGRMGEQALILLGDGRHCPVPIAVAAAESTGSQTITVINIDLAGVRLPFVPTTIRMLSLGLGGGSPGFDVGNVRARVLASQIPTAAYPYPPDDACDVPPHTILTWRPGPEADRHIVYFGRTLADVGEGAEPVTDPQHPQEGTSFDPGFLELGQRYYWRVDEVNTSLAHGIQQGEIWEFQVADREMIDGFESSDVAWALHEGWFARTEVSGPSSEAPIYEGCRSLVVHFGVYANDHTGIVHAFDTPQDWAATGAETLQVAFHGHPDNAAWTRLYVRLSDGQRTSTVYYGDASAVTDPQWHLWRIPLEAFTGLDQSRINGIVLGVAFEPNDLSWGVWGQVSFDSIALSCSRRDQAENRRTDLNGDGRVDYGDLGQMASHWLDGGPIRLPVQEPNAPIAWYRFEGNANDSIGSAHGRLEGSPRFVDGRVGQALSLSGTQSLDLPPDHVRVADTLPLFHQVKKGLTVAFWQLGADSLHYADTLVCSDFEYGAADPAIHIALGDWDLPGHYQWHCGQPWTLENSLCGVHGDRAEWAGRWNHWTFTTDLRSGQMAIFLNGSLYAHGQGTPFDTVDCNSLTIGTGWYGYYDGLIDELRIYDYALGQAEAAYLATDGSGLVERPPVRHEDLNGDDRVNGQDLAILAQDWLAGPVVF